MADNIVIEEERKARINAFLEQPLLARIATVSIRTGQPHVYPVWFLWDGESIWISAYSSTRKVKDLQKHPKCAIVIDSSESKAGLTAVLLEGEAELVSEPRDFLEAQTARIYIRYLGEAGVLDPEPQEWLHSPENLLIKLTPQRIFTW